jgi:hypothetical protein
MTKSNTENEVKFFLAQDKHKMVCIITAFSLVGAYKQLIKLADKKLFVVDENSLECSEVSNNNNYVEGFYTREIDNHSPCIIYDFNNQLNHAFSKCDIKELKHKITVLKRTCRTLSKNSETSDYILKQIEARDERFMLIGLKKLSEMTGNLAVSTNALCTIKYPYQGQRELFHKLDHIRDLYIALVEELRLQGIEAHQYK